MSEELKMAAMLGILQRNLSPLGLQTAAMLLLSHIAKQAEAAAEPTHGGMLIDQIAATAKQFYRRMEVDS